MNLLRLSLTKMITMVVNTETAELQAQLEEYFPVNEAEPYVLLERLMTLMWDGGVDWGTEENGAVRYAEGFDDGIEAGLVKMGVDISV